MSELGDTAAVLRALHNSLKSIENHVATQVSNVQSLRESIHDLKNKLTLILTDRDLSEQKMIEIDAWMGTFDSRLTLLADDVVKGFRDDRSELTRLRNAIRG